MPRYITIADPADPRIEPFRQVRERDLVGRQGRFVIEGEVVLRTAVRAGRWPVRQVLLAEKRLDGLIDCLALLPDAAEVFTAGQAVLDGVVGFHIHRGILALGDRAPPIEAEALLASLGPRATVVVLFGIGNHDNMGGVFRNAAAFGADAILLADDCCDPLYRKAIRVSVGAALTVPFAAVGADALELLARHGFQAMAFSPAGTETLAQVRRPRRAAVILGAEGPGLPPEVLAAARTISIPMAGSFDSLNVATTSGIVLHHLAFGPAADTG